MNIAYLSLGSNIGDRKKNLQDAKSLLTKYGIEIIKESNIYESEPWGFTNQDWFLNQCIKIATDLSPENLLKKTQEIEKKLKKNKEFENGPRTIDIDILTYNDININSINLQIPHPRMSKRNFVLYPLSEIVENPYIQKLKIECEDKSKVNIFTK